MKNNAVPASAKQSFNVVRVYENLLGRYWIPTGFLILLSGFFWAPSQHNYKVIVSYAPLLPSLLSVFTFRRWREWFFATPLIPLLMLYLAYMVTMAAIRGAEPTAFAQWSIYILIFLFGISMQMRIEAKTLNHLLLVSTFIAALAAIYTIIVDAKSGALWLSDYRLIGYATLYNPLKSGHLFGVFVIIGVWCGFVEHRLRALCWTAAAICLLTVLLTGSRAPCLALLAVSIWNIVGLCRGRAQWLALAKLGIFAVVVAFLFWHKLSERGMSLRPEVWGDALSLSLSNIWVGKGLGSQLDIPMSVGGNLYDTHNVFLAALYYGGIVGVILFVLAFGASIWGAWQRRHLSPLFLLAATLQIYGLCTLQFDGGSLIGRPTEYWILYWVPMALFLYELHRSRESSHPFDTKVTSA